MIDLRGWDKYGAHYARYYKSRDYSPKWDLPSDWLNLDRNIQEALSIWIDCCIKPTKTFDPHHSSYGMKHVFQRDSGHYTHNGQFKGAMILKGYRPNA